MPQKVYELNPVEAITAGAVGEPGHRVFYIQARTLDEIVTLISEKEQVQLLARGIHQFLAELDEKFPKVAEDKPVGPLDLELRGPFEPNFRIAQMGLGYDRDTDRVVLVAHELVAEEADAESAAVARFWGTRAQMRAMADHALEVAARGRPTCPLCGHLFDALNRGGCQGCPLVKGCETFCCPACGYVDVDPERTTIGRWLTSRGRRGPRPGIEPAATGGAPAGRQRSTLVDVPVGWRARIAGIEGVPASRKDQLRAYGLLSGDWIRVLQHTPVTVALVEHTELALDADLAHCILVDGCEPSGELDNGSRIGLGRRRRAAAQP